MDFISDISPSQIKMIKITFIIIFSIIIASYFKHMITKQTVNQSQNKIVLEQISNIIYYGILAFGLILVLIEIGVQKTTVYTLLVSIGFTVGISFQSILSRCLSGVYIIMMNLYDIGDKIKVSSTTGTVKSFNLFNTTVYDETEKNDVVIPNNMIGENKLINFNR